MNSPRKKEAGYTLLELLLVALITMSLIGAFGAFMLGLNKTIAQYSERARQNEDSGLTIQTLTDDLERTGSRMTVSSKEKFTGDVQLSFIPNNDYQVTDSEITVNGTSANSPLISQILWNGKGKLRFQSNLMTVSVYDSSTSRQMVSDRSNITIYENGVEKGRVLKIGDAGDFSIIFSSIMMDGQARCRTQYQADDRQIYESTQNCPSESQQISFQLPYEGYIYSPMLTASQMSFRDSGESPVRLPLLPFYEGERLTSPMVKTENGFFLLAGDISKDEMYLTEDQEWSPRVGGFGGHFQRSQYITLNDPENLTYGDVLLVCDYLNNRSVVLQVAQNNEVYDDPSSVGRIPVTPLTESTRTLEGWIGIYSPSDDYLGYTFSQGTRVVKLFPPIEYKVSADDNETALYRRVRGESWELVLPNIENFSLTQDSTASRVTYEASFNVKSEGVETSETGQLHRISVSPRALNRTYDAR